MTSDRGNDRSVDVKLHRRWFPFTLEFSSNSDFPRSGTVLLDSQVEIARSFDGVEWENKFAVKFNGRKCTLDITDAWCPVQPPVGYKDSSFARVAWKISLPFLEMSTQLDPVYDHNDDTNHRVFTWKMKDGYSVGHGQSGHTLPELQHYEPQLCHLRKYMLALENMKFIRLTVWRGKPGSPSLNVENACKVIAGDYFTLESCQFRPIILRSGQT